MRAGTARTARGDPVSSQRALKMGTAATMHRPREVQRVSRMTSHARPMRDGYRIARITADVTRIPTPLMRGTNYSAFGRSAGTRLDVIQCTDEGDARDYPVHICRRRVTYSGRRRDLHKDDGKCVKQGKPAKKNEPVSWEGLSASCPNATTRFD